MSATTALDTLVSEIEQISLRLRQRGEPLILDPEPLSNPGGWGPNGYADPFDGNWRNVHGEEIAIFDMSNSYIQNCIKFLTKKFGYATIKDWRIYKNLNNMLIERGIDGRNEWDN